MLGVFTYMNAPGMFEDIFAICNNNVKKKFKNIPKNSAITGNSIDTKYTINPNIVTTSIIGPAKIFEIQNVSDIVLNIYAIIGIIRRFAVIVILNEFITTFNIVLIIVSTLLILFFWLLFSFNISFYIDLFILSEKNIIPIVTE